MSDEDQKLRVRLVGRNGRRRYEAASKERLVAACLEPGVSVSRLALEYGVNANLLRKWIKKDRAARSLPSSSPSASRFSLRRPPSRLFRGRLALRRWICRRLAMKWMGRSSKRLQLYGKLRLRSSVDFC